MQYSLGVDLCELMSSYCGGMMTYKQNPCMIRSDLMTVNMANQEVRRAPMGRPTGGGQEGQKGGDLLVNRRFFV